MLYYTPFMFLSVIWLAYEYRDTAFFLATTLMFGSSILFHAKAHDVYAGKWLVSIVDIGFAHGVLMYTLYRNIVCSRDPFVFACIACIIITFAYNQLTRRSNAIHAFIHCVGTVGMCKSLVANSRCL